MDEVDRCIEFADESPHRGRGDAVDRGAAHEGDRGRAGTPVSDRATAAGVSQATIPFAVDIPVKLSGDPVPTPAVSLAIKQLGAAGGVVITSSTSRS